MSMQRKLGAALALLIASNAATAQTAIDVSAAVGEIGAAKVAVLAIGVAVFSVAVGVKLYKWLRGAL